MKRYTKKGPRRSRAMPVSSKRFVVALRDCEYVTNGKSYRLEYSSRWGCLAVIADNGEELVSNAFMSGPDGIVAECFHLGGMKDSWRWVTL